MKKKLLCLVLALCCLASCALADQALTPGDTDLPEEKAVALAKAEFQTRFGLTEEQMGWFRWEAALWEGQYYHEIADESKTPERVWDVYFSYDRQENTVYHDMAADFLSQGICMDSQTGAFVEDDLPTDDIFAGRLAAHLAHLSDETYMTSRDKAFQAARDQLQDDSGMTDAEISALIATVYLSEPGKGDGPQADVDWSKAQWHVYFESGSAFAAVTVQADTLEVIADAEYLQQAESMSSAVQQGREQQELMEKQIEAMNRWEAEKGAVITWSYEDRAAFYAENGFSFDAYATLQDSWLLPEADDIGYDAALQAAREALQAHGGMDAATLDALNVSAAFGQMSFAEDWGNSWSFTFWQPGADGTEDYAPCSAFVSASGTAYYVGVNLVNADRTVDRDISWFLGTDGTETVYDGTEGNG